MDAGGSLRYEHSPLPGSALVIRLAETLADRGITYCQWKGHWNQDRWGSGQGDIDLLIGRESIPGFRSVLATAGFRPIAPLPEAQIIATDSFLGHDPAAARLVHVHAHYRLVLGDYWRTLYQLPLERPILDSVCPGPVFPVPAPEWELLLFVLRMVDRYSGAEVLLGRRSHRVREMQAELAYLESRTDPDRLDRAIREHLPGTIHPEWLERCIAALRPTGNRGARLASGRQLAARLSPYAVRPPFGRRLLRPFRWVRRRIRGTSGTFRPGLADGGIVVALVGGDGAGKSTCAAALHRWLAGSLRVQWVHLGKPPRSLFTGFVGVLLKMRTLSGGWGRVGLWMEMLRHVCTARDRYRLHGSARRTAARGGIAICERFPVRLNALLVGPVLTRAPYADRADVLSGFLRRIESRYYRRILEPDVVIVLRLDPDVAVRRKTTEPPEYVRARAQVIWDADWASTRAHVVDASRSLSQVLADIKAILWSAV